MNYIDELAVEIWQELGHEKKPPKQDFPLYRMYGHLALMAGIMVSNRQVHDAWSCWMAGLNPKHPSLIPFDDLRPEVQELDTPYREAIAAVAARRGHI